jgi:hypothetical protein
LRFPGVATPHHAPLWSPLADEGIHCLTCEDRAYRALYSHVRSEYAWDTEPGEYALTIDPPAHAVDWQTLLEEAQPWWIPSNFRVTEKDGALTLVVEVER